MVNDLERVRSALNSIPPNLAHDEWVRTGMAARDGGMSFEDWSDWSAGAENYSATLARDKWRSFKDGKGVGVGTLYKMAAEHGWRMGADKPQRQAPAKATTRPIEPPRKPAPGMSADEVMARLEPATNGHAYILEKRAAGVPLDSLRVVPAGDSLTIQGERMAGALVVPVLRADGSLSPTADARTECAPAERFLASELVGDRREVNHVQTINFLMCPHMSMPYNHGFGLPLGFQEREQFGRVVQGGVGARVEMMMDKDECGKLRMGVKCLTQPKSLIRPQLTPSDVRPIERVEQDQPQVLMINHADPPIELGVFQTRKGRPTVAAIIMIAKRRVQSHTRSPQWFHQFEKRPIVANLSIRQCEITIDDHTSRSIIRREDLRDHFTQVPRHDLTMHACRAVGGDMGIGQKSKPTAWVPLRPHPRLTTRRPCRAHQPSEKGATSPVALARSSERHEVFPAIQPYKIVHCMS